MWGKFFFWIISSKHTPVIPKAAIGDMPLWALSSHTGIFDFVICHPAFILRQSPKCNDDTSNNKYFSLKYQRAEARQWG